MKMILNKNFAFVLLAGTLGFGLSVPVYAQDTIRGQYNPQTERSKEDTFTAPAPKIFSQKIQHSIVQALRVDTQYQNLKLALWNYAQVDFTQQAVLLDKMQPENFRTTRYKAEFTKDLNNALTSLNANYKNMKEQIESTQADFDRNIEGVTSAEEQIMREIWDEKTAELKKKTDEYFKMQHSYILLYQNLTKFLLAKSGGYYYDEGARAVRFYDVANYTYFAGTIDKLHGMTMKQKKFLKDFIPHSDLMKPKNQE